MISIRNKWKKQEASNGIGLENLRGQLGLLYGDKFDLRIGADDETGFLVNLALANNT